MKVYSLEKLSPGVTPGVPRIKTCYPTPPNDADVVIFYQKILWIESFPYFKVPIGEL